MKTRSPFTRSTRLMVLAAFAGAGFLFGPVAANFQTAEAGITKKLLRKHNKERKKRNRKPLRKAGALNQSARKYALLMATTGHFSHTGPAPDFSEFNERIKAEGFNKFPQGENIAQGQQSIKEVMRSWMSSAGHRKNILSRKYKSWGGGKADSAEGPYWVTNFGG